MDFNTWANHVQFGIDCEREKLGNFIELYENAKFFKATEKIKVENANCNINNSFLFNSDDSANKFSNVK